MKTLHHVISHPGLSMDEDAVLVRPLLSRLCVSTCGAVIDPCVDSSPSPPRGISLQAGPSSQPAYRQTRLEASIFRGKLKRDADFSLDFDFPCQEFTHEYSVASFLVLKPRIFHFRVVDFNSYVYGLQVSCSPRYPGSLKHKFSETCILQQETSVCISQMQ